MNEMQLVEEFRAVVAPPDPEALARSRAQVLGGAAHGQGGRRGRWPRLPGSWPKLALTGLAAAVTAAVVTVALAAPGGAPSHSGTNGLAARELAYRAADAAAARPYVRPGQWVYLKEKIVNWLTPYVGLTYRGWTTADGNRTTGLTVAGPHKGRWFLMGRCPRWQRGPDGGCLPFMIGAGTGRPVLIPITYADLKSLPRNPAALDRYLAGLPLRGAGPASYRELEILTALLFRYVTPSALTAELYRAVGDIPGVTVNRHVADVAGRVGIGFQLIEPPFPPADSAHWVDQLILNPKTYDLMGMQIFKTRPRRFSEPRHGLYGIAILQRTLVSGLGARP